MSNINKVGGISIQNLPFYNNFYQVSLTISETSVKLMYKCGYRGVYSFKYMFVRFIKYFISIQSYPNHKLQNYDYNEKHVDRNMETYNRQRRKGQNYNSLCT